MLDISQYLNEIQRSFAELSGINRSVFGSGIDTGGIPLPPQWQRKSVQGWPKHHEWSPRETVGTETDKKGLVIVTSVFAMQLHTQKIA